MSRNKKRSQSAPAQGKRERYMQPCLLMGLHLKPSYGYELIQTIPHFGFIEGEAPPGMVYRHLRQLEEEALVSSEWETDGSGPAKRMYRITPEGEEVLRAWVEYMERQAENLNNFIERYRNAKP